ncbi:organomercurial lyase [Aliikangiella sp. IMCC44359]|uniref:organomercurial lyase n=1 Tax=Aliikangiella sp. IMCC44359 TaxID=3459125 RepID=UPI00403B318F
MKKLQETIQHLNLILPKFSELEKRVSKYLYIELAKGYPVPLAKIVKQLDIPEEQVRKLIDTLAYVEQNQNDEIIAYRGVTLSPTKHALVTNNSTVYTWCAFDTLFLLDLIDEPAHIHSTCAACNKKLILKPSKLAGSQFENNSMVMSLFVPEPSAYQESLRDSFCCKVHFFCNETCGQQWSSQQSNIELFSVDDSLTIAQERNRFMLEC